MERFYKDKEGYVHDSEAMCNEDCESCERSICIKDEAEEDPKLKPYEPIDHEDEEDDEIEFFYGYSEEEIDI
jgi:hypothetical protein